MERLSEKNFSRLNGIYSDYPDTTVGIAEDNFKKIPVLELWSHLDGSTSIWDKRRIAKRQVALNCLSSRRLVVQLLDSTRVIDEKVIKGKFKEGYFYRRPYFMFSPLVPLLFGYTFERYRIGLSGNVLTIDSRSSYWWSFFIVGGTCKIKASSTYNKAR